MEPVQQSIQEYIRSREYFLDARKWYNTKYLYPLAQRSFLFIFCSIFFVLLIGLILKLDSLLPIITQVRYSIWSSNFYQNNATIIHANDVKNNSVNSIADIMIKNYIIHRESYNYDNLKKQFIFIKNNSTRIVFRRFYNFMDIDNPLSPILRYQKYIRRSINVISTSYPKADQAVVVFESVANNSGGENLEKMLWQATINFEIDEINLKLPPDSRFNFTVTDYRLKLLEDKNNK